MTQPTPTKSAPEELQRIHLYGSSKKLSGRAVRYRILSLDNLDNIELQIIRAVPNGEILRTELRKKVIDDIMGTSIRFISEPVPMVKIEAVRDGDGKVTTAERLEPAWDKAKWFEASSAMLLMNRDPGGRQLFGVKDLLVLRALFSDEYDVSQADLDGIIAGKAAELVE